MTEARSKTQSTSARSRADGPKRSRIAGLAVVGVVLASLIVVVSIWRRAPVISLKEMIQETNDGDRIINAVLRYRDDRRAMPARIEDLVPGYIAEVPASPLGAWSIGTASPGRPAESEFSVRLVLHDDARRHRTGYERIACYVEIGKRADWRAIPLDEPASGFSLRLPESLRLRQAAIQWTK